MDGWMNGTSTSLLHYHHKNLLETSAACLLPLCVYQVSHIKCFLQVSEAILDNARLMLQTENIQANAEDFKDRSQTHTHTNTNAL